jgi:hypothetical protein
MPVIWEAFIRKYNKQIPYVSLGNILNAFWLYEHSHDNQGRMKEADRIMGYEN